ncbi:hypothetical protein IEQ34_002738 [Dendrobium chrysotoxum]|uniref:Uncharacterized protein n=1 Tax=Dendrobium chrysotoxum TaxID=161865 RepID=A0AAV7HK64_DENCH|nr:hypothetical protein IEQ34_002738 [Dendrobium chrysotoxum]
MTGQHGFKAIRWLAGSPFQAGFLLTTLVPPDADIPGPPFKPKSIERQKSLGLWALKLPSADAIVVRRTFAALTENPQGLQGVIETDEHKVKRRQLWPTVKPAHFGVKIGSKSPWAIIRFIFTGFFIGLFGMFAFGRKLLLRFPGLFSLGWFSKRGPTEEEVNSATFKMWFVGQGYSDVKLAAEGKTKPDTEIITRVSGPEIGYLTTSIILIQCAFIVLSQRKNLPNGGVYPPGIIFGATNLQEQLQRDPMQDPMSRLPAASPSVLVSELRTQTCASTVQARTSLSLEPELVVMAIYRVHESGRDRSQATMVEEVIVSKQ